MKHMLPDGILHNNYKIALLIKEDAIREREIEKNYLNELEARGLQKRDVIVIGLPYNDRDKAPVSLIKEFVGRLEPICQKYHISHLLVADAAYFKVFAKVRKAEPYYGYVLPSILPGVQAALTINYGQLFYNPSLKSRLVLGITALTNDLGGKQGLFEQDLLGQCRFPQTVEEIETELHSALKLPQLTCDVETTGLHMGSWLYSVAIGISEREGFSFLTKGRKQYLREFLDQYLGTVIYHNAIFDTKMLISNLYMEHWSDYEGMLHGLHTLHRDIEDTQILAYLALNSTAKISLKLKDLAFEYVGNYALDEDQITDVTKMDKMELLRYNVTDTLATWYVYNKYRNRVREEQEQIYQQLYRPTLKTITQTEIIGMPFSKEQVRKTDKELSTIKATHLQHLKSLNVIKHFESLMRVEAAIGANQILKVKRKTADDFADLEFNPNSHPQLQKLFYEYLGLPVFNYTDKGNPSTDGKTIDALIAYLEKQ